MLHTFYHSLLRASLSQAWLLLALSLCVTASSPLWAQSEEFCDFSTSSSSDGEESQCSRDLYESVFLLLNANKAGYNADKGTLFADGWIIDDDFQKTHRDHPALSSETGTNWEKKVWHYLGERDYLCDTNPDDEIGEINFRIYLLREIRSAQDNDGTNGFLYNEIKAEAELPQLLSTTGLATSGDGINSIAAWDNFSARDKEVIADAFDRVRPRQGYDWLAGNFGSLLVLSDPISGVTFQYGTHQRAVSLEGEAEEYWFSSALMIMVPMQPEQDAVGFTPIDLIENLTTTHGSSLDSLFNQSSGSWAGYHFEQTDEVATGVHFGQLTFVALERQASTIYSELLSDGISLSVDSLTGLGDVNINTGFKAIIADQFADTVPECFYTIPADTAGSAAWGVWEENGRYIRVLLEGDNVQANGSFSYSSMEQTDPFNNTNWTSENTNKLRSNLFTFSMPALQGEIPVTGFVITQDVGEGEVIITDFGSNCPEPIQLAPDDGSGGLVNFYAQIPFANDDFTMVFETQDPRGVVEQYDCTTTDNFIYTVATEDTIILPIEGTWNWRYKLYYQSTLIGQSEPFEFRVWLGQPPVIRLASTSQVFPIMNNNVPISYDFEVTDYARTELPAHIQNILDNDLKEVTLKMERIEADDSLTLIVDEDVSFTDSANITTIGINQNNLLPGDYITTITAKDDCSPAHDQILTYTFSVVNAPPSISIIQPLNPSYYTFTDSPQPIDIAVQIPEDQDGISASNIELLVSDEYGEVANTAVFTLQTGTNDTYVTTWTPPQKGDYALRVTATDDVGEAATTPPVSVYLRSQPTLALTYGDGLIELSQADDITTYAVAYGQGIDLIGQATNQEATGGIESIVVEVASISGRNETYQYDSPTFSLADLNLPPGDYTITLYAYDEFGIQSLAEVFKLVVQPIDITVNFKGCSTTADQAGTLLDNGAAYALQGHYTYGWLTDISAEEFCAAITPEATSLDPIYHSYLPVQLSDGTWNQWTIDLPNGTYRIELIAGNPTVNFDPSSNSYQYRFLAEGDQLILDGQPNASQAFLQSVSTVIIRDGQFNLSLAPGSQNTVITAISISQISLEQPAGNWEARFTRGAGDPSYQSAVIPLDFQKGITYPNQSTEPGATTSYHLLGDTPAFPLAVSNPIVAFGEEAGGSPLYTQVGYRFGVHSGTYWGIDTDGDTTPDDYFITNGDGSDKDIFRITATPIAGGSPISTTFTLPRPDQTTEWDDFTADNFSAQFDWPDADLRTSVTLVNESSNWGSRYPAYMLTHFASSTDYIYTVEVAGATDLGYISTSDTAGSDVEYSPLYTMQFSARPIWETSLLRPNFTGEPLPPFYYGKSLEELLAEPVTLPALYGDINDATEAGQADRYLDPYDINYTKLESVDPTQDGFFQSPELRVHQELDAYIADYVDTPLSLVNYVHTEIELSDALGYSPDSNTNQVAIYPQGIKRSAYATFMEGRGSPYEQCALLVYMLRRAGVPAAYASTIPGGLEMLDAQVSRLLSVNIEEAAGITQTVAVNYPWVVAYMEGEWRHFFPWIKDYQIIEGEDINKVLSSTPITSGTSWSLAYLSATPSVVNITDIDGLTVDSDQAAILFPEYLRSAANTYNAANDARLSLDSIGFERTNRRHYYNSYEDFPKPFSLENAITVSHRLDQFPGLFDTIEFEIYSYDPLDPDTPLDANKVIRTNQMLLTDLHNRQMVLHFEQRANPAYDPVAYQADPDNYAVPKYLDDLHDMILTFEAFDDQTGDYSGNASLKTPWPTVSSNPDPFEASERHLPFDEIFGIYDPNNNLKAYPNNWRRKLQFGVKLGDESNPDPLDDQYIRIKVTRRTLKAFASETAPVSTDSIFDLANFGNGSLHDGHTTISTKDILKGDTVSLIMNYGQVSNRMHDKNLERTIGYDRFRSIWKDWVEENGGDPATAEPNFPAEFHYGNILYHLGMSYWHYHDAFEQDLRNWHKVVNVSDFSYLWALLRPDRDSDGSLIDNGTLKYRDASLDMAEYHGSRIFNGSLQAGAGIVGDLSFIDYSNLRLVHASAAMHETIGELFPESLAESAVSLLQRAAITNQDPLLLTKNTYSSVPTSVQDDAGTLWDQVELFFADDNYDAYFRTGLITDGFLSIAYDDEDEDGNITPKTQEALGLILFSEDGFRSGAFVNGGVGASDYNSFSGSLTSQYLPGFGVHVDQAGTLSLTDDLDPTTDQVASPAYSLGTPTTTIPPSADSIAINDITDWDTQITTAIANGELYIDPITRATALQAYIQKTGDTDADANDPNVVSEGLQAVKNKEALLPQHQISGADQLNPANVNLITGALHLQFTDLQLPAPIPVTIGRNYDSTNSADGHFGSGWKGSFHPYILLATSEEQEAIDDTVQDLAYVNEPDGSVTVFVLQPDDTWKVEQERNPTFAGTTQLGSSPLTNLLNATMAILTDAADQITLTENGITTSYAPLQIAYPDGSTRLYLQREFTLGGESITRWYIHQNRDSVGNTLTYQYGLDQLFNDYGQVNKITSSNGFFLRVRYDNFARVREVYTGENRSVQYYYDQYGDLVQVIAPDGTSIEYEYIHAIETDDDGVERIYSTHLLWRQMLPDGRVVETQYDDNEKRRVVAQYGTVGSDLSLVQVLAMDYHDDETYVDPEGFVTGKTTVTDAAGRTAVHEYIQSLVVRMTNAVDDLTQNFWFTNRDTVDPADTLTTAQQTLVTSLENFLTPFDDPNTPEVEPGQATGGAERSKAKNIGANGIVTTYTYLADGNRASLTVTGDLTGNGATESTSKSYQYYPNQFVQKEIDNFGNETVYHYEDTERPFMLTRTEYFAPDPDSGGTPTFIYENVITYQDVIEEDGQGNVTRASYANPAYSYQAFGSPEQIIGINKYDARGFTTHGIMIPDDTVLGGTNPWDYVPGENDIVNRLEYNDRGEVVAEYDASGDHTKHAYDALGRQIWSEVYTAAGERLSGRYIYYNSSGEVSWTDGPMQGIEDYVFRDYDGAGRLIMEIVWRSQAIEDGLGVEQAEGSDIFAAHSVSQFFYDSVGNLIKVIDPEGNQIVSEYDDLDRIRFTRVFEPDADTSDTSLSLRTEEMRYTVDPENASSTNYASHGKVTAAIDPAGNMTRYYYTDTGKIKREEYPDGTFVEFRYDHGGRITHKYYTNGTYLLTTYNDYARTVSRQLFKEDGSELAGTKETDYFDRRQNPIKQVNPQGLAWEMEYDDLNRIVKRMGPVISQNGVDYQQVTQTTYDNVGKVTRTDNALGEYTISTVDTLNRPVSSATYSASGERVSFAQYEYDPNHVWAKNIIGSGDEVLIGRAYADTFGNTVLAHSYESLEAANDPASHATEVVSEYTRFDKVGRAIWQKDEIGQITQAEYDALGQLEKSIMPDGAFTTFDYDPEGRGLLLRRNMPKGLSWVATYDELGRMLTEEDRDKDGQVTRFFQSKYYDATSNLDFRGMLEESTDPRGIVTSFEYDPDYGRIDTVTSIHPSNDQLSMTTANDYDIYGRLIQVDQSSPNDAAGPATRIKYTYNGYSQLTSEETLVQQADSSYATHAHWEMRYDVTGARTHLLTGANFPQRSGATGPSAYLTSANTDGYQFAYDAAGRLTTVTDPLGQDYSYQYLQNGLLKERSNTWRSQSTTAYDPRGFAKSVVTRQNIGEDNSALVMAETPTYRRDGKLQSYNLLRNNLTSSTLSTGSPLTKREYRYYAYNSRNQLTSENIWTGSLPGFASDLTSVTAADISTANLRYDYAFDQDDTDPTKGGLGVRQSATLTVNPEGTTNLASNTTEGANVVATTDGFGRVTDDVNTGSSAPSTVQEVHGTASGADKVELSVDGVVQQSLDTDPYDFSQDWSTPIFLQKGYSDQVLRSLSFHASGQTGGEASRTFALAPENVTTEYDEVGNTTKRTWSDGSITYQTEDFYYDVAGRLIRLERRVLEPGYAPTASSGYNWTATYDPVGRRIATSFAYIDITAQEITSSRIDQKTWYDPQVEFLALAVETTAADTYFTATQGQHAGAADGGLAAILALPGSSPQSKRTWKVYGPDGGSGYGALQGIGGLEAFIDEETTETTAVVLDYFANVVAWIKGSDTGGEDAQFIWHDQLYYGYGHIKDNTALAGEDSTTEQVTSSSSSLSTNYYLLLSSWRSRGLDLTGYVYMGARYYDPTTGKFLSADPAGHAASMSLYDYANGDPINYVDPDGRLFSWAKKLFNGVVNFVKGVVKAVVNAVKAIGRAIYKAYKAVAKFVKKYWRIIVVVAVAVFVPYALAAHFGTAAGSVGGIAAFGSTSATGVVSVGWASAAIGGALSGFVSGVLNGNLSVKGVLTAAATAVAFNYVGAQYAEEVAAIKAGESSLTMLQAGAIKTLAHGVVGGVSSVAYGGDFVSGFVGAAAGAALTVGKVGEVMKDISESVRFADIAVAAVTGGAIAELTGGSFEMGALQAGFSTAFNNYSNQISKKAAEQRLKDIEFIAKHVKFGVRVDVYKKGWLGGVNHVRAYYVKNGMDVSIGEGDLVKLTAFGFWNEDVAGWEAARDLAAENKYQFNFTATVNDISVVTSNHTGKLVDELTIINYVIMGELTRYSFSGKLGYSKNSPPTERPFANTDSLQQYIGKTVELQLHLHTETIKSGTINLVK